MYIYCGFTVPLRYIFSVYIYAAFFVIYKWYLHLRSFGVCLFFVLISIQFFR